MDFVMITWVSEKGAAGWELLSDQEKAANVEVHLEWFGRHRDSIFDGHELAWPRRWGRIAGDRQLTIHDGPFAETKEALGGFILLRADSLEDALEIARTWPSFDAGFGATVDVIPLGSTA